MCTIVLAKNVFPGFPVVVAANRDELLDRPSETPKMRSETLFAPRDLQRGGMWIGINKHGVIIGLTNRLDVKSVSGRKSRGQVVQEALQHTTAASAVKYLKSLTGSHFNGFYLIAADKLESWVFGGNGREIDYQFQVEGLVVVSNHGFGQHITPVTTRRVKNTLSAWHSEKLANGLPTPERLKVILDLHDEDRYGTCINQPDDNYGTKSSSIIQLESTESQDIWHYWHRERSSNQHICQDPFKLEIDLPIKT